MKSIHESCTKHVVEPLIQARRIADARPDLYKGQICFIVLFEEQLKIIMEKAGREAKAIAQLRSCAH